MPIFERIDYPGLMGKRDAQLVTQALYTLADARLAVERGQRDEAIETLDQAREMLAAARHAPGVSVATVSGWLGVSEPTVRSWAKRGVLRSVPATSPLQIEPESLREVSSALAELRERGQDHDWLQALVDHLHDREARESEALKQGLAQLARGELEPA